MNQPQPRNPAETYENYFVPAMFLPWATILLRHAAPQSGNGCSTWHAGRALSRARQRHWWGRTGRWSHSI